MASCIPLLQLNLKFVNSKIIMIRKIAGVVFTALCCSGTVAQNADSITIRKFAEDILTNGKAYENLRWLCKKIGPRLSGSPQAQKAVEATAGMLKDAGADTVYLQPCMVP